MLGAIVGDMVGSIYEHRNHRSVEFPFFGAGCTYTDDTILTVALADAIMQGGDYIDFLKSYARKYPSPMGGYGTRFSGWAFSNDRKPYNSLGNGSAMRTSPVGFAFQSLETVLAAAEKYSAVTHNHPEGIKGAQATAASIFLARQGKSKQEIRAYISEQFGYNLERTCDQIRRVYQYNELCSETVPEAIIAFLDSNDFEHAIRLAISLGGDSDTLACITGGIAEAYYGIPRWIEEEALGKLDNFLRKITLEFREKYPRKA